MSGNRSSIGVVILGIAVTALLTSLGRCPGLPAKLSQDYMGMMAGSLAPTVQAADGPDARACARRETTWASCRAS